MYRKKHQCIYGNFTLKMNLMAEKNTQTLNKNTLLRHYIEINLVVECFRIFE